jgi:hypothetical protein
MFDFRARSLPKRSRPPEVATAYYAGQSPPNAGGKDTTSAVPIRHPLEDFVIPNRREAAVRNLLFATSLQARAAPWKSGRFSAASIVIIKTGL